MTGRGYFRIVQQASFRQDCPVVWDSFFIYIMTNKTRTVLYTGVTNSLLRRVVQHRRAEHPGFTARYRVDRLVYYEEYRNIRDAIAREKQIKSWRRSKKTNLIDRKNPQWNDLAVPIIGLDPARGAPFAGQS